MSDSENLCSALGIPERLHTAGRPVDSSFAPDERIYRRFKVPGPKETWSMTGIDPSVRIFDLSEDSYNRSKYCEQPEDVLYNTRLDHNNGEHYYDSGILAIRIDQLLSDNSIVTDRSDPKQVRQFTFDIEHAPEPCMYPHTNVNVLVNGIIAPKRPPTVKLAFRLMLREYLEIIKPY